MDPEYDVPDRPTLREQAEPFGANKMHDETVQSRWPLISLETLTGEARAMLADVTAHAKLCSDDTQRYYACFAIREAESLLNSLLSMQRIYTGQRFRTTQEIAADTYGRTMESIIDRDYGD